MKRLVETTIIGPDEYSKSNFLTESDCTIVIQENNEIESGKYTAKAVYTFPISKPGKENLNGRIYSEALWKNTESKMANSSTFGLMDHPENEGSTKDIWCVWRNLRFSENRSEVVADAYLIGKWGEMVNEILNAGGKVGLSTSGFGEMLEDSKTIDPNTYELERMADFVFNPSYQVFGTKENVKNIDNVVEKVETDANEEKRDNMKEEVEKVTKTPEVKAPVVEKVDTKKDSFLAKSFRLNMVSSFKEAKKLETVEERKASFADLLTYFEDDIEVDLKHEIEEEIKKEDLAVIQEAKKADDDFKFEFDAMKLEKEALEKKYNESLELLDSVKVYSNKLKEMYDISVAEKNGMVTATEYREAQVYLDSIEKEKTLLEKEIVKLRTSLKEEKRNAFNVRNTRRVDKVVENVEKTVDEPVKEVVTEAKIDMDKVNPEVADYYSSLEYSNPAVVSVKEDILRCRTIMEAQRTVLRLRPLWEGTNSAYDRKASRPNATYLESSKQKLSIKNGWL